MASYPPPLEFNSIFNEAAYLADTTGITIGQADLRYLKLSGGILSGLLTTSAGISNAGQLIFSAAGNVNNPAIQFVDSKLGLYRHGSNHLRIGVNGTAVQGWQETYIENLQQVRNIDGTVALPAVSFANNTNTGLYLIGVNNLGISCNGVNQVNISTTTATFTNPLRLPDGGWTFSSSTNTGFSYTGANRILVSTAGNQAFVFGNASTNQSNYPITLPTQNAGAPSLRGLSAGITTTGLFFKATPSLGVSVNGIERVDFTASSATYSVPINMNANNITNCPQVGNTAGNLTLAVNSTGAGGTITLTGGTDLIQGTAGGSSGQHLKLIINGTAYKIALLNN